MACSCAAAPSQMRWTLLLPAALRLSVPHTLLSRSTSAKQLSTVAMPSVEVEQFRALNDNYAFLVHDASTGATMAIDTPEVSPIMDVLNRRGWKLSHVLNTHHHHDHAGGNLELKRLTGCKIIGPAGEASRIPGIDTPVGGGDSFEVGNLRFQVIDVGGHTKGHIAFYNEEMKSAFVGDSLFALGCGRLFEGTPEQAWASLQRLAALPPDTKVYCAHEYTEANLRFALSVDSANPDLQDRAKVIKQLRSEGKPTVPTSIELELMTNPFMRASNAELRAQLGVSPEEKDAAVFGKLRKMKDKF
uniref:hydroxyacylglutathione hydrolase n=1 Tax=Chrysotila carterae TaxID=13221 RepID=A0A7S4EWL3_CHRCT